MSKPTIALVVPDIAVYSGVPAVALYLHRIITAAGRHEPHLISIATSAGDRNSVRFRAPGSWGRARQTKESSRGVEYSHVGAFGAELEFQRYRPRKILTNELKRYDLVQVIAGTPPWALVARDYDGPIALQVATLTAIERETILRNTPQPRRAWMQLMSKINTTLEPRALRLADVVFVENAWMYERLLGDHGPGKIVFAAPGIDTDFFTPTTYNDRGHILSVGRFADPRKNVGLLFRAYSELTRQLPGAPKLVLAGETAPAAAEMALADELGIRPRIQIESAVGNERLRELYRSASQFVLSSNEEGLGIVILEAMACGLPVVSTSCGGPETSVVEGETGYLTPLNDASFIADRMKRILVDSDTARRMGAAGRERAVDHFSLLATGRVYLDKYDELLAARDAAKAN